MAKLVAAAVLLAIVVALLLGVRQLTGAPPTPPSDAYVQAHHGPFYEGPPRKGPIDAMDDVGNVVTFVQYHGIEWRCWTGESESRRDYACEPR
jgi:hypothetical protein